MFVVFWIGIIGSILLLSRNVIDLLFSLENHSIHKRRMRQLNFESKKQDMDISEIIETVTEPIINHLFPKLKFNNLEQLETDLKMAKWDKYFTPIRYRALDFLLKAVGIVVFILLFNKAKPLAFVWGGIFCFGLGFLFRNTISNRKTKLFYDFPELIRVVDGYLSADVPFAQAVADAIKYVGDEWKPILHQFVIDCDMKSIDEALEGLKNAVDLFEVKEFVALVRLTLEQGGDARKSFEEQAEKITEMQRNLMAIKIGQRETMGMLVQGPLLICNLLVFALPTVSSMTSLTTM